MKTIKFLMAIAIFFIMASSSIAMTLGWDASSDATGYIIYYQDTVTLEIYNYDVGNVTDFTCDPLNMVSGHSYDIWLKAYNAIGLSGESNHVQWSELPSFIPPANHVPTVGTVPENSEGLHTL